MCDQNLIAFGKFVVIITLFKICSQEIVFLKSELAGGSFQPKRILGFSTINCISSGRIILVFFTLYLNVNIFS